MATAYHAEMSSPRSDQTVGTRVVSPLSPVGTIGPVLFGALGGTSCAAALVGLIHPWGGNQRQSFLIMLAFASWLFWLCIRRFYFSTRRMTMTRDGTVNVISRWATLVVPSGELISVLSIVPFDLSAQYPGRVTARGGSLLITQRMRMDGRSTSGAEREKDHRSLTDALAAANPDAILDARFVRGVEFGPIFGT